MTAEQARYFLEQCEINRMNFPLHTEYLKEKRRWVNKLVAKKELEKDMEEKFYHACHVLGGGK